MSIFSGLLMFVLILGFLYLGLAIILYFVQEKFIFLPTKLSPNYLFSQFENKEEIFLHTTNDGIINALHFKCKNPRGIILYFHGNARSLDDWAWVHEDFLPLGHELFIADYRSYGKSKGPLSENNLYEDALAQYQHLLKQFEPHNIVIYGRSLGSAMATELATKVEAKCLVLETPFTSIMAMAGRFFSSMPIKTLLKYKFNNIGKLKLINVPIYIFGATNDEITPIKHARKLAKRITNGQYFEIEGATHGNLSDFKEYHEALKNILKN